jgi:hypothetical protein
VNVFQHFPQAAAVLTNASDVHVRGKSPGLHSRGDANWIMARRAARVVRNASTDHVWTFRQLRRYIENLGLWGAARGHDFRQVAEPGFGERFADWIRG